MLTSHIWLDTEWDDEKMGWDPDDYNQLKTLRIPSDLLWKPDVVLYNRYCGMEKNLVSLSCSNSVISYPICTRRQPPVTGPLISLQRSLNHICWPRPFHHSILPVWYLSENVLCNVCKLSQSSWVLALEIKCIKGTQRKKTFAKAHNK